MITFPIWSLWIMAIIGFIMVSFAFISFFIIEKKKLARIILCCSYIFGCILYWNVIFVMLKGV